MQTVKHTHMTCSLQLMKNVLLKKTDLDLKPVLLRFRQHFIFTNLIELYNQN